MSSSLKRLKAGVDFTVNGEVKQFCAQSQTFFVNSTHIFNSLGRLPGDLASLRTATTEQVSRQTHDSAQVIERLDAISLRSRALVCRGDSTGSKLEHLENRVSRSISALISIARNIKEILGRLQAFSKDFSDMITANGRKLLDIHAMMKRLVRAVEAIPLHLTLAIVRLDDALGESWALPYQACQTLHGFKNVLKNVVFADGRPGARHVEADRFVIRSVNCGQTLKDHTWVCAVKEGAHLTQAMVVSEAKNSLRKCLFADCVGALQSGGNCWLVKPLLFKLILENLLVCGRTSSFETRTRSPLGLITASHNNMTPSLKSHRERNRGVFGPLLPGDDNLDREVKTFRNVHLVERRAPIKSVVEAEDILNENPCDPNASQYFGWYLLQSGNGTISTVEAAIAHLEHSISSDATRPESHYLLGRAYMLLRQYRGQSEPDPIEQAYNAYQQAVYFDGCCNILWMSVGLLYFHANQRRDALDAMARSIRLYPYEPLVWRNLGLLYDICGQKEHAKFAYTRAFDLGLDDFQCQDRLNVLRQDNFIGYPLPPLSIQMQDFDLRAAIYETREFDEHGLVELAGLRLDDSSYNADSEASDDDWVSPSDDKSDGQDNYPTEIQRDLGVNLDVPTGVVE